MYSKYLVTTFTYHTCCALESVAKNLPSLKLSDQIWNYLANSWFPELVKQRMQRHIEHICMYVCMDVCMYVCISLKLQVRVSTFGDYVWLRPRSIYACMYVSTVHGQHFEFPLFSFSFSKIVRYIWALAHKHRYRQHRLIKTIWFSLLLDICWLYCTFLG